MKAKNRPPPARAAAPDEAGAPFNEPGVGLGPRGGDAQAAEALAPAVTLQSLLGGMADVHGLLEVHGRHEAANRWVLVGWIHRAWPSAPDPQIRAIFERGECILEGRLAQFDRADLSDVGVGFVVVAAAPVRRVGKLLRLEFIASNASATIVPSAGVAELRGREVAETAQGVLAGCPDQASAGAIREVLAQRFLGEGYVDLYGSNPTSGGWFACGWLSNDWITAMGPSASGEARFEAGSLAGAATLTFLEREDILGHGLGFVLHLPGDQSGLGRLLDLTLRSGEAVVVARPSSTVEAATPETVLSNISMLLSLAEPSPAHETLTALLVSAPAAVEKAVLPGVVPGLLVGIDDVIDCGPDSLIVFGWLLAKPGAVRALRLRSGDEVLPIDLDQGVLWIDRVDVIDSVGRDQGFDDPLCGFIARAPMTATPQGKVVLEIEMRTGEIVERGAPPGPLEGLAAIKRILGAFEASHADVDQIYDHVIGPPIRALNRRRLEIPPRIQTLTLGAPPPAPRCSVIVPLYGRIDFMEFQMAVFAVRGLPRNTEILYVLDDPPRAGETRGLAASLYERFGIPFRVLLLSRNLGFAPANNVGLRAARGEYVCLMNSDVFPTDGDWVDRLTSRLAADATLGMVGPVLLFEDESVQHQGIAFKPLAPFGGWAFPMHKRKGFRRPADRDLVTESAITGACMMLRRADIGDERVFDEDYIIGDLEDTDLCFRLRDRGLTAAVDHGVAMYHLERKSQASSAMTWRTNLTLYNAWVHQRRWGGLIETLEPRP